MDAGARFLVAVGGDGTVQEVVNGMFRDGRPIVDDPVLGVVAAYSGCDLVKSFGLPGDVDAACGHLLGENTYPFDVVKVAFTGPDGERAIRYSVNLAEIGFGAAVTARSAGRTGRVRSFVSFWSTLARTRLRDVRIEADRSVYEGPAFNVIVGNAQFASGGMRLSPRSFPGDGVADVLVFTGPRSDAYTLLPGACTGTATTSRIRTSARCAPGSACRSTPNARSPSSPTASSSGPPRRRSRWSPDRSC